MATIVLAHGSWQGGWCWWKFAPLLRQRGHNVTTPTYTGLGERRHLLTPEVGLYTHTEDIVQHLEHEDLHDVVLVGHSYGGAVISEVAEFAADRLTHLIYLDAFLPEDGETVYDLMSPDAVERFEQRATELGEGWYIPPFGPEFLGLTDEADIAFVGERLSDEPVKTHTEAVRMPTNAAATLKRTYIRCADREPFFSMEARAKETGIETFDFVKGHNAFMVDPIGLADLIEQIID